MKKAFFSFILSLVFSAGFAFHYRAGEITYSYLSGTTYQIELIVLADSAGTDSVTVYYGDGDSARIQLSFPNANVTQAHVTLVHTYPGDGQYAITCSLYYRVPGIVNFVNSAADFMYLETQLKINSLTGPNSSSISISSPYDQVTPFINYVYNTFSFDPDGDSLGYSLLPANGQNYWPPATQSFHMSGGSGNLSWKAPYIPGPNNFLVVITEWRYFSNTWHQMGYVQRDMEIVVTGTAGMNNASTSLGMTTVYPNPSNADITIQVNSGNGSTSLTMTMDDLKLEVMDISGRKVEVKYEIKDQNIIVNREGLVAGFYIYKLSNKEYLSNGKFEIID